MSFVSSARARIALAIGLSTVLALSLLGPAGASSHREAPLITEDPVADNTDTYFFRSPTNENNVVMIANWIPLQEPAGGPNFYNFGDDVLYEVNIDNDGDAVEDITYEWRFTTTVPTPGIPFYNGAPITVDGSGADATYANLNLSQTYTLTVVRDGVRTVLGSDLPVPPNNVGPRSTPDYDTLADAAITQLPNGITSFAGQRDEVFQFDLGSTFDLGGLRPLNNLHAIPLETDTGKATTDGFNVHSVVLEVPIDALTEGDDPVLGLWSSTYRRKTRVFADGFGGTPAHSGPFVQVSRLGMPVVNEVVIPLALKDAFNAIRPDQDAGALAGAAFPPFSEDGMIPLVQDPILGNLLPALYPPAFGEERDEDFPGIPPSPRDDLVQVFLTGIPEINMPASGANTVPAEMIRLNTSVPVTPFEEQSRLGFLGGDNDGFPNGRRLIDDTIDISLRAVAGGYPLTPDFNEFPNNALTDGVDFNDKELLSEFPYIPDPFEGYEASHFGPAENNPSNDGN